MSDWTLPRITDYWDQQVDAIGNAAARLRILGDGPKREALREIAEAVAAHVRALTDEACMLAAVAVSDDLYKAASSIDQWHSALGEYLEASAAVFFANLTDRGFLVRYAVDNAWADMTRPLGLFPDWFSAAGSTYICPQAVALELLSVSGKEIPGVDSLRGVEGHIEEARHVAAQVLTRCDAERKHVVYLDTDSSPGSFEAVLSGRGAECVITVFREQAPAPESTVEVWYPTSAGMQ